MLKTCGLGDPAYWLGAPFHSSTAGESATLPADLPLLCLHQSQCWLQGFMGCFLKDFEEGIWGINTVLRRIVSWARRGWSRGRCVAKKPRFCGGRAESQGWVGYWSMDHLQTPKNRKYMLLACLRKILLYLLVWWTMMKQQSFWHFAVTWIYRIHVVSRISNPHQPWLAVRMPGTLVRAATGLCFWGSKFFGNLV